jgi:putative salt-induced outer membrane protein YdiY
MLPTTPLMAALCVLAVPAEVQEMPPVWSGQTGVSYVATTGNTDTSTLGASGELVWQPGKFKLSAQAAIIRAENADAITSKRVDGALRMERALQDHVGAYAQGAYYRDLFAGVRNQEVVEAGGFYRLLRGERRELTASLSLAQTWEERVAGPYREFLGAKTGVSLRIRFNGAVALEQQATYTHDFSVAADWRAQASARLTSSLGRILAVELAYKLYYTDKPDTGVRRTDTATTASLVAAWPKKPQ